MHVISAFLVLVVVQWKRQNPVSPYMVGCSLWALLPDVFDKLITGNRYPLHSFVVMIPLLLILNLLIRHFTAANHQLRDVVLLGSIAMLTHPIMDLEGPIPLFFPLLLDGYQLDFELVIIQSFPPVISTFTFQIIREPFDFIGTAYHEGVLVSNLDILFLILALMVMSIYAVGYLKETRSKSN